MRVTRPALLVLTLLASLTLTLLSPTAAQAARSGKGKSSVSVLTFNVCGHAQGCGGWDKREDAIVKRIVASKADVVAVQEVWGVFWRLEQRLATHGYVAVASSGNEGMFAKSSKLSAVTVPTPVTTCTRGRIDLGPEVDTTQWDPTRPHRDESGVTWYHDEQTGGWFRTGRICTDSVVQTPKNGQIGLGGRASSAWAMLRVKRTDKTYLFASVHLTTGKDKVAGKRATETSRLLAATAAVAEGRPRVFAGDFNSSIQRGKDTVGRRLRAKGFSDAYTEARSHKGTRYNSATGYGRKPRVGGSHIDRVFVPRGVSASTWAMDVKMRRGRSVRPIPSDHSPVRVSITLP
ncbi:MAG: endonuclease/exonuclease/phosphatase family protein [Aeromicrobium sp.]